jgi:hypothetical protein
MQCSILSFLPLLWAEVGASELAFTTATDKLGAIGPKEREEGRRAAHKTQEKLPRAAFHFGGFITGL